MEDVREQDDASLVVAAQGGEQEAFAQLYRRHYATVRRVCARRMSTGADADEVAQAAFVRAYERIHQCSGDRRFGAWVQVIALRMCGDAWRAGARVTPMADPSPGFPSAPDNCVEGVLRKERAAAVRCALATLPPRQREVIVARYVDGRRPRDVAAALAVSVGAVDSLLLRARRRMLLAYEASGADHGAISTSVTTTSVAAGSAATRMRPLLRPLARLAESFSGALDALGAGVAGTVGLSHVAPTVAQRAAGLVGAGALLFAPLAVPGGGPAPTPPGPAAPALSLGVGDPAGAVAGGLRLPGSLTTALPSLGATSLTVPALSVPLAVPALSVPLPALPLPALPLPALPIGPSATLGGVTTATGVTPPALAEDRVPTPSGAGPIGAVLAAPVGGVAETLTATVGTAMVVVTSAVDQVLGAVAGLLGIASTAPPALP